MKLLLNQLKKKNYGTKYIKSIGTHNNEINDSSWNLDLSNRDFIDSVNVLKSNFSEVSIVTSKFPYNNRIVLITDPGNQSITIKFAD